MGQHVGVRILDVLVVRERGFKRETKLLQILIFVKATLWKVFSLSVLYINIFIFAQMPFLTDWIYVAAFACDTAVIWILKWVFQVFIKTGQAFVTVFHDTAMFLILAFALFPKL